MNTTALALPRLPHGLQLPRLHGPGLAWLPAVWRLPATWKTVLRFVIFGPLIGGAPYVVFIVPIPFAYLIGAPPALIAGWLFASWYHAEGRFVRRAPRWPQRALMGALSGVAATAVVAVGYGLVPDHPAWFMVAVTALHGVPAAVVLALVQRPAATGPSASPAEGTLAR